jgi:hypothetical protein
MAVRRVPALLAGFRRERVVPEKLRLQGSTLCPPFCLARAASSGFWGKLRFSSGRSDAANKSGRPASPFARIVGGIGLFGRFLVVERATFAFTGDPAKAVEITPHPDAIARRVPIRERGPL